MEQTQYPHTNIDHPESSYIIIDLEWNQPIPWIRCKVDPKELPGEIIEIGAVKLTVTQSGYVLSKPFHVMIRPVCYTVMNKNVSRVINKISSDLRFGMSFLEAYDAFVQWCGQDYILCGWGNSDISILKSNLAFHQRSAELKALFLDVQPLFARIAEGKTGQRSVEYAVDFLRIPKQEDFHAAHKDAEYTGLVLKELLLILDKARQQTVNSLPAVGGEQKPSSFHDLKNLRLAPYLQNPDLHAEKTANTSLYSSWEKCYADYPKEAAFCPACQKPLINQVGWFRLKKSGFSLWHCEDHYMVLGRMRMKKTPEGKFYASVLYRLSNPGAARSVSEKLEEYEIYGSKGKPVIIPPTDNQSPELAALEYSELDSQTGHQSLEF